MTKTSFFILFALCEILKIVCCGSDSSALQTNMQTDNFIHDKNEDEHPLEAETSDVKSLEKRRLFYPGSDSSTEIYPDKFSTNDDYSSRRRSSQGRSDEEQGFSEEERDYENDQWENEKSRFSLMEGKGNVGGPSGFQTKQSLSGQSQAYGWEKGDRPEKSQWSDGKHFRQMNRPNSDPAVGSRYFGRTFHDYPGSKSSSIFDRRISIATSNEADFRKKNKFMGDYRIDDRRSGYYIPSNKEYNSRNDNDFWDPNIDKREKGVIINFNTECPMTRQFNNQLLHRVIITPKPSLNTNSEVSLYQFPGAGLISSQLTPKYYF